MSKQLMIFSAIIDILTIFADTEIGGQYEFDYDAIDNYISSLGCQAEYFDYQTKDEIYAKFTQDIYNGLPVWRFLKLPDWTTNMVEKSFKTECENELEQLKKIYKCLTCKYFHSHRLSAGLIYRECKYEKMQNETKRMCDRRFILKREESFELKTTCDNYEKVSEENEIQIR